jgi:hypothetical protein
MLDHTKLPSINTYQAENRIPEPRVITLSPNSLRFLNSIGALQLCNQHYLTPFNHMLVYEEAGRGYMKFDLKAQKEKCQFVKSQEYLMNQFVFNEAQKRAFKETQESMGASVENSHLLAALVERTRNLNKCDIIQQKVVEIKRPANSTERPSVRLEDGTVIEADLIIGSDGEKSKTREEYGIKSSGFSYE